MTIKISPNTAKFPQGEESEKSLKTTALNRSLLQFSLEFQYSLILMLFSALIPHSFAPIASHTPQFWVILAPVYGHLSSSILLWLSYTRLSPGFQQLGYLSVGTALADSLKTNTPLLSLQLLFSVSSFLPVEPHLLLQTPKLKSSALPLSCNTHLTTF